MPATAQRQYRHNLPVHLDSFMGRRREIAEVRRLMERTRLLTLTGPGGVGKTRLAGRVAVDLLRVFPDGVQFVELGELGDPSLLPAVVATSLGLRDLSTRSVTGMLSDFLAERQLLLVLDNCEHLLDASALLTRALLRTAPALKVLATSRQPLGVEGEVVLVVPPLTVPPKGGRAGVETMLQYEAVSLFVDRAVAVQPGFALPSENAATVAELCRRLEGIPLAIELAAGRLRALTVDQILDRLGDRLRLLGGGRRTASPRHRTLEATIEWSHDLLSEPERVLWRRLSVFGDGFELEAAENVCGGPDLPTDDVLDALTGLIDKSIVLKQALDGRPRYRILEGIRQYGHRRLVASGEEAGLRRRHLAWFAALGEKASIAWWGPAQAEWFDRLEADHANLRGALGQSLTKPEQLEAGVLLASSLWLYWHARGRIGEGRQWLSGLLGKGRTHPLVRSRALAVAAYLALAQDDADAARPWLEEALELARRAGSDGAVGVALGLLGWASILGGDLETAAQQLDQAVALHHSEGSEPMLEGMGVYLRAVVALFQGDGTLAADRYEHTVAFCRLRGERWLQARALLGLAMVAVHDRQEQLSAERTGNSLRLAHELDDRWGTALAIEVLAWASIAAGHAERGVQLLGAANSVWASMPASVPSLWERFHDHHAGEARRWLGEQRFEAAFAKGADLSSPNPSALLSRNRSRGSSDVPEPATCLGSPAGSGRSPGWSKRG